MLVNEYVCLIRKSRNNSKFGSDVDQGSQSSIIHFSPRLTWHLVSVTSAQTSSSLSSHCFTKAVSHCSAGTSAHTTGSYVDTSTQNSWPVDKEDEGGFNNFARVSRVRELRASSVSDISWVANGQNWQNYLYKWRENNKLNQVKMY